MKLDLQPNLDQMDVVFDHDFIFEAHTQDRRILITRYRGTVVRPSDTGFTVAAWQKSVYHFGGLNREVPVYAVVLLDGDGNVRGLSLDERCLGSQGKRCDFRALQIGMNEMLKGTPFEKFTEHCPNAGAARCLHLFELLGGAAGFFAHVRKLGLTEGSEQEIVRIRPDSGGLTAENRHILLGKESVIEIDLRHNDPPRRNENDLTAHLNAEATVRHQGAPAFTQTLKAETFPDVCRAEPAVRHVLSAGQEGARAARSASRAIYDLHGARGAVSAHVQPREHGGSRVPRPADRGDPALRPDR